jgi:hypothetical protein
MHIDPGKTQEGAETGVYCDNSAVVQLRRGSTILATGQVTGRNVVTIAYTDQPGVGTHTYSFIVSSCIRCYGIGSCSVSQYNKSLLAMEVKR